MEHKLIKAKVIAEIDVSPDGLGTKKIFSFLMEILSDTASASSFMIKEGYSPTEVSKAKNHYQNKQNNQVLVADGAF